MRTRSIVTLAPSATCPPCAWLVSPSRRGRSCERGLTMPWIPNGEPCPNCGEPCESFVVHECRGDDDEPQDYEDGERCTAGCFEHHF